MDCSIASRNLTRSDIDITTLNNNEMNSIYCDWFPNDKRNILFDLCKPIPKEFTDIDFLQPIISTYNCHLALFIKALLDLIRPKLPDSVMQKICELAKVVATPEKFPVMNSRMYTANDLEMTKNSESMHKSEQDEDMEIIEVPIQDKHTEQKDTRQTFGIWQIATEDVDWATCPIGQLPWTQVLPDSVENMI
ncbi:uncharacterized protein LOC112051042 isoform X2 [Bicyclus anynana]|uniref:Uncharacterized protein LOC112051042 isoform X2 n=1 Tax=Bicyclus anynana TaxID=110368 RepID=A0ABM3LTM8_BICAN|nr:uncharacterized protein LOC112051042 isoform X2 [Bicyclus anynana]